MELETRSVTAVEAVAASAVVHASFVELAAADWTPQAQQVFLAESSSEALAKKIQASSYAAGTFAGERMVGFLLMPNPALLGMLFVHPQWLRRGIAQSLWESARAYVESAFATTKTIELNATPYSLPFYRSVGFVPISAEFKREGCRATRMACWLPARALGAECGLPLPSGGPTSP